MKSYGVKSLIELCPNLTVIKHQLNLLNNIFTNKEIVLISGFQRNKLMDAIPENILQIENERYNETNVLRSIGMGLRIVSSDRVLIIYGDLVCNARALAPPFSHVSYLVLDNQNTMTENEIGCTVVEGKVTNLSYDLPVKWGQIMFLTGAELALFRQIAYNSDNEKWFGFEAINEVIRMGGQFKAVQLDKATMIDIDTPADIARARKLI
jgi:choline kinase